ncbi:PAS domain-containing protein [Autumnicola psychrophila]|uniref:histidine kinase n=1 Tax=Autumnicola psychrophila TaxID=3075592 RepID=A0ABU3DVR7_9FLAO|nr:PAS domain S-box protein [Zunongwangia sp. F225]MDT0687814.1 PAS domain S-box protein [Zunongwangia sp. F225]
MRARFPKAQKLTTSHKNQEKQQKKLKDSLYQNVRENEFVFDFIQENSRDGTWIIDLQNPVICWMNPKFREVLGINQEHDSQNFCWQDFIISEDLQKVENWLNFTSTNDSEIIKFQSTAGYPVWMKCRTTIISAQNKNPLLLIGLIDITRFQNKNQQLIQELQRYEHIIEGTNIGAWEWNVQTGEAKFNERWANVLGYRLDEIQPTSADTWKRFAHPEDMEKCDLLFKKHFAGETEFYEGEARMKNKAGEWIWVLDKGKVVSWTADGKPEWMTGFHEEITQRKKEFERNQLFIDQAPSAIAMFDKDMNYLAASQKWLEENKIEAGELIGKCHYELCPYIKEEWREIHSQALQGAVKKSEEDWYLDANGKEKWLSWEVRPWYNYNNQIGGILVYTNDITPLKSAEKENLEKQVLMQTILDNVEVGIISCDKNGRLTSFNKATKKLHGIPLENIATSEYSEYYGLFSTDGKTMLKEKDIPLLKTLWTGKVENEEILIKKRSGDSKLVSVNGSQLKDANGNVRGAVVAMHDITSRKETEDKLRISEQTFRGNFENAAIGMAIVGLKGEWIEVNEALCDIVGYTQDELINLTFQDITHPEDLNKDLENLQHLVSGKGNNYQMEKRYIHKEGYQINIILAVSIVRNTKSKPLYFVSHITDITRRRNAEQKLQHALAQLKGIFEASSQVSVISTGTNGIITNFNRGAENLLGYPREEMEGKRSPALIHLPEEIEEISKELSAHFGRDIKGWEIFAALAKRGEYDTREWTYVRKDGTQFPVQLTFTAIRDNDDIIGYLGVAADISEIKKVEQEVKSLLELTKDQNQRLRNFAHIVSHNLRSHSGNFGMLLDLYKQDHPEAAENEIVQLLGTASDNLKETVAHLNEVVLMNTKVAENLLPINLQNAINRATKNVSALSKEVNLEIINNVDANFEILGIPAYVESILLNFLTNGIKYRSPDRKSYIKLHAKKNQQFTILKIEDNGLGIDLKKYESKLFGMYNTFHHHKDARGIGLFITKNQIEAIGGKIEVESEVGKGTIFKLYLKYEEN